MTAALVLASFGVASVILEAKPERDPVGSKALCMQRDVLDVLERFGCGIPLRDEGVTWTLGRTYYRDHELFQITFPESTTAVFPPFVNVGQDRTEFHLEQRVIESPLIELRYGSPVVGIEQDPESATVSYEGQNAGQTIVSTWCIGADGAGSVTRKLMGLTFDGHSFEDQFLICDIRAELPFANERRFFFDPEWNPDRQVLIHPQADSVWRIDWQVPPDFDIDAETASGGLEERIQKIVDERDYEIVWMSVYRFHQRIASQFHVGRVFLAGDAAHIVAPFGARGLNSGIQDAENLAWKLGWTHNGWSPTTLVDTYQQERRPAAEENLRLTGATMDFLVPPTPELWETRRRTLEAALANPDARSMVDSGQLATPFVYAGSPLTSVGGVETAITLGSLVPDGPISVADKPAVGRLRQLFGHDVVVLTTMPVRELRSLGPVGVHLLATIDTAGAIAASIGATEPVALIVRPDGHLAAAVRPEPRTIERAMGRAVGAESA